MALTAGNVRVAVTGAVYVGPTATAAPTDASTALVSGFKDLGYLTDDGLTESSSRSTSDIKAWQGAATVRTVVTDASVTYNFKLMESTKGVLGLYYGQTVSGTSVSIDPSVTGGTKSFVFDIIDGTSICRIYIPSGEVTDVGDITYASGDAVSYEVTITAYVNSGVAVTKFFSALPA